MSYCQAQPSPNSSLAEVALFPIDPATHSPAGKVKTSLWVKSNYIWTVSEQCMGNLPASFPDIPWLAIWHFGDIQLKLHFDGVKKQS